MAFRWPAEQKLPRNSMVSASTRWNSALMTLFGGLFELILALVLCVRWLRKPLACACVHAAKHLWSHSLWLCDIAETVRLQRIDYIARIVPQSD